jgi:alpha-amylase
MFLTPPMNSPALSPVFESGSVSLTGSTRRLKSQVSIDYESSKDTSAMRGSQTGFMHGKPFTPMSRHRNLKEASAFSRRSHTLFVVALLAGAVLSTGLTAQAAPPDPNEGGSSAAQHSLREAATDQIFYFVMADRFANGDPSNDEGGLLGDYLDTGFEPTKSNFYNGGDLAGLLSHLDYIAGLGTTAIWLTPSFKNKPVQLEDGPSAGYHGYWVTDFTQIDPHLGTNQELQDLVNDAHVREIKVFFDIITNHTADVIGYEEGARTAYVSKDAAPYLDADGIPFDDRDYAGTDEFPFLDAATSFPYIPFLEPGEEHLKVPDWLNDVTLYHNRGNTTFTGEDSQYGDFFGLDDLWTEHPAVVNGFIDIYETWVNLGIDGYRIDTMKHVNDEFWRAFGPAVLAYAREHGKNDFFMFGEVFDESRPFTSHYTTANKMQAVLDFPFQSAARKFASRSDPAKVLETLFLGDDWYTDADSNVYQLPTFLGNHDAGRIGAFLLLDNPGAGDEELVARSRLAHELMFFSRGNPVIYYGDEQGFTGTLGFEGSRQSMFASQVPDYLDDDLIGTESTHAQDNYDSNHVLYKAISDLARLTREHPALRNGAHQHRYADDGPGIYAFSRIAQDQQREYVVALNNSEEPRPAEVPTYVANRTYERIYGSGPDSIKTSGDALLGVTVPALSTVVYASSGAIPRSRTAPAIAIASVHPAEGANGRIEVNAEAGGTSFYEVTFLAKSGSGKWVPIGTDDTAPYRVFHDVSDLEPGAAVKYRAIVRDNAGHTRSSGVTHTEVPAPILTIEAPEEGASVRNEVEVRAVADPERATHIVNFERSINGGAWEAIGTDDSSPTYTAFDDISALPDNTGIRYCATLTDGNTTVVSAIRTVTVGNLPQPDFVSVPGSLNSEMGCSGDWQPDCEEAQLTFDSNDQLWKLTVLLPAGDYEYKVAIDKAWDENYGAGGVLNGANISLSLTEETVVTFTYDHATHIIVTDI